MSWSRILERRTFDDATLATRLGLPPIGHGMAFCPAHEDRHRSLSWRWTDGRLLVHCFAGCDFEAIRRAT